MRTLLRGLSAVLVVLAVSGSAVAAPWTGILDPSRAIDWSLGNQGIPGGIPARTTICSTLGTAGQLPSFAQSTTQTQLQNAIFACPTGQTVLLNPGTYTMAGFSWINGSSSVNGVTLRGSGPDQTIMKFTSNGGCSYSSAICLEGSAQVYFFNVPAGNIVNWTAGYTQGATSITVSDASSLRVGMYLVLDQLDDSTDPGGVSPFVCFNRTFICHTDPSGTPESRPNRAQQQTVQVTAISGTTLTIAPGLYMTNWRSGQSPQAWWWDNTVSNSKTIQQSGIESMTLDFTSATFDYAGVHVVNAVQCWYYRIRSLRGNRNHLWLHPTTMQFEVRDSYFFATKNASSTSYAIENESTDALIVNNIGQHVTAPILMGASTGTVVAYNYSIDMYFPGSSCSLHGLDVSHQGGGALMGLWEGNETNLAIMDVGHGTGSNPTFFRNQLTGSELGKTNCIQPSILQFGNRVTNWVGNILGKAGVGLTGYESTNNCTLGNVNTWIYYWGYSGSQCDTGYNAVGGSAFDPTVSSSALRWGNYDYATGTVRWQSSEIPSGNAVPATHALPASFFLSGQPAWWSTNWGTPAWPVLGPDVTGGQDSLGYVYKNPARLCYENTPGDTTYTIDGIHPLLFIPTNCYGISSGIPGQTTPGTPSRLTIGRRRR